jgi:hypothetical protein
VQFLLLLSTVSLSNQIVANVKTNLTIGRMRIIFLGLALCFLCGCLNYDVTLQNGDVIRAKTKPKLQDGSYVFKDLAGRDVAVKSMRVRQIEPVRAGSPPSTGFIK